MILTQQPQPLDVRGYPGDPLAILLRFTAPPPTDITAAARPRFERSGTPVIATVTYLPGNDVLIAFSATQTTALTALPYTITLSWQGATRFAGPLLIHPDALERPLTSVYSDLLGVTLVVNAEVVEAIRAMHQAQMAAGMADDASDTAADHADTATGQATMATQQATIATQKAADSSASATVATGARNDSLAARDITIQQAGDALTSANAALGAKIASEAASAVAVQKAGEITAYSQQFKGARVVGTPYAVGDRFTFRGSTFQVTAAHTALTVLNRAQVTTISLGLNPTGAFVGNTQYYQNDTCTSSGNTYRRLADGVSGGSFDAGNWELMAQKGDAGTLTNNAIPDTTTATAKRVVLQNGTTLERLSPDLLPVGLPSPWRVSSGQDLSVDARSLLFNQYADVFQGRPLLSCEKWNAGTSAWDAQSASITLGFQRLLLGRVLVGHTAEILAGERFRLTIDSEVSNESSVLGLFAGYFGSVGFPTSLKVTVETTNNGGTTWITRLPETTVPFEYYLFLKASCGDRTRLTIEAVGTAGASYRLHGLGAFGPKTSNQNKYWGRFPIGWDYRQYVAIGNGAGEPAACAALDVASTDAGVLFPRMTQTQREAIASVVNGLVVYQNDTVPGFMARISGAWQRLMAIPAHAYAAPSIVAGAGLGGGSANALLSNASNLAGKIVLITGTAPLASSLLATVTFSSPLASAPRAVILQANSTAAAEQYTRMFVFNLTANGFEIRSANLALGASNAYDLLYSVTF